MQEKGVIPVYVWEIPVRVFHWLHVASIVVLAFTGYYIGNPFIIVPSDPSLTYTMGVIRAIHFVAAFVMGLGFLLRVYWFFVGNRYANWREWIPTDRERWAFFWKQFKYYIFLEQERPLYPGHNPVAGLSYAAVGLMILFQGLTGFALYAEPYSGGFWRGAFGWLLNLLGNQNLRMIHHVMMWLFTAFLIVHLYMAVLGDIEERNAAVTSIITGIKIEQE